ncbi:hypothetical protein AHAT_07850 [Agarivorans sp. Toyoura001]|uniref:hypothetical protein n=1 Tax=Agarivorans sp. Toyoura001 TaxID=2283141 RepID=UPI0010E539E5|nr:hypothetical protein [Agarivorans sp. Toyoura001]GDY24895.1 hypothetical protein AHAT_07850 [Agarivorans sp. Toyoura001]
MKGELIEVEHPRNFFARTQVMTRTYRDIAEVEYTSCMLIEELPDTEDEEEMHSRSSQTTKHAIQTIVFSAMSIEAAINNYAGTHLGDKYFESHLSSLDVVSKWIVIPKLVCGNEIDKSSAAFGALKALIRARNQLVHSKSRKLEPTSPKLIEQLESASEKFTQDFRNSLKALYLLAMEMDFVVGQQHNPLGTMDSAFTYVESRPEPLNKLFHECKNIVLKNHS